MSVNAVRVLTFDALLERVWGFGRSGSRGSVTYVKRLRRKLGEDADSPKYIFASLASATACRREDKHRVSRPQMPEPPFCHLHVGVGQDG